MSTAVLTGNVTLVDDDQQQPLMPSKGDMFRVRHDVNLSDLAAGTSVVPGDSPIPGIQDGVVPDDDDDAAVDDDDDVDDEPSDTGAKKAKRTKSLKRSREADKPCGKKRRHKHQSSGDDTGVEEEEAPAPATTEAPTTGPAKPRAAGPILPKRAAASAAASAAGKRYSVDTLLPRDVKLACCALLDQPGTLQMLLKLVGTLHPKFTLYFCNTEEEYVLPSGEVVRKGYRGLAVDSVDALGISMVIARIPERVTVSPPMNADWSAAQTDRFAPSQYDVHIEASTLATLLKGVDTKEPLAMYVVENEANLTLVHRDAEGNSAYDTMRTLEPNNFDRQVLSTLEFSFELVLTLTRLREFVSRASALGIDAVTITIREYADKPGQLLCLAARSNEASIFDKITFGAIETLTVGVGAGAADAAAGGVPDPSCSSSSSSSGKQHPVDRLACLKGKSRTEALTTLAAATRPDVSEITQMKDIEAIPAVYTGSYSTMLLGKMMTSVHPNTLMTLFLEPGKPMMMRLELGKADAYIAFYIADKVDEQ